MEDSAIIVPARLGSQRFPGKLLKPVLGRPLILWTADNLRRVAPGLPLYFAVAEQELKQVLEGEGLSCLLTDPGLPSGTDRVAAANRQVGAKRVINVQADEPVLAAEHVPHLIEVLESGVDMATLATPFTEPDDFLDPNKVKVVTSAAGRALYFSRSPVPFDRETGGGLPRRALWHLGLYGYHKEILERFTRWAPSELEQTEKLEQLRVLENGGSIGVGVTATRTVGVDVPADLDELERVLKA
ncbi:MAG: 3-deoxy-manno-octulosonate cytidylyltransferase [Oceanipulchritudo sp.]